MYFSVLSPAKLNLFLQVLFRRTDGYHEICTLFQRIDLADRLNFNFGRRGKELRVICDDPQVPQDESNSIIKSLQIFSASTGIDLSAEVHIEKNIPVAGGLGGGSSNAAAALEAANEASGFPLDRHQLIKLSRRVGADVPFFIYKRAAWAYGIGDRLWPAMIPNDFYFLVITIPLQVSTSWAYKNVRLQLTKDIYNIRLSSFKNGLGLYYLMSNDFEDLVISRFPIIEEAKKALIAHGAGRALMSGSGPTCFGIFQDCVLAEKAYNELKKLGRWQVYYSKPIPENWGVAKR
jgi:4-diphosphocytidyl-2-C-methyl-D-erythritol kinase